MKVHDTTEEMTSKRTKLVRSALPAIVGIAGLYLHLG